MPDFNARLRAAQSARASALCVGLDPDPERLPAHLLAAHPRPEATLRFTRAIIEATAPFACAFKVNFAFYEALGPDGWHVLSETIAAIPDTHLVIADAKRGDIGNSARFYADSIFDALGCDACTVAPYMGRDSVTPFLEREGTAAFVLARTSNPGGDDFQLCRCGSTPLFLDVAERCAEWSRELPGTAGLVAGATNPEALGQLRRAAPTLPFLIPGVGAQGGDATLVMQHAATDDSLVLVNSSRGILYAASGEDFAEAAAAKADTLRQTLQAAQSSAGNG